jgi:hypothetical protein
MRSRNCSRAHRARAVRSDLRREDIRAILMGAMAMQSAAAPKSRKALASLICEGLKPGKI